MKKIHLLGIVVLLMAFLTAGDFFLNGRKSLPAVFESSSPATPLPDPPSVIEGLIEEGAALPGYRLQRRSRVQHLFEKVSFDSESPLAVFYHLLESDAAAPIEFYEIHGPATQGNLTYFKVKQRFLDQGVDATAAINEVGLYGHNSFFYNDQNYPEIAFLVVQTGDNVYGIKYKKDSPQTFDQIQEVIRYLMDKAQSFL